MDTDIAIIRANKVEEDFSAKYNYISDGHRVCEDILALAKRFKYLNKESTHFYFLNGGIVFHHT